MNRKQENRKLVYDRLSKALDSLYHAATLNYPDLEDCQFKDEFDSWLSFEITQTIQLLENYEDFTCTKGCTDPLCNLNVYAASRESVREETRKICQPTYRYVVRIYTWGRGGRTCAPLEWVNQHGGSSFSMKDADDFEMPYADIVSFIETVEAFYSFVREFCKSIPERWQDHVEGRLTTREEHLEAQAVD